MKRTFASACAVAAILSIVATGCTQQTKTAGGTDTDPAAGGGTARELTAAEEFRLERAEQLLIKKCMGERGFRYWFSNDLTEEERRDTGYVQDDVAWAEKHGYGGRIQDTVDRSRKHDPNTAYTARLPKGELVRYNEALGGDPDNAPLTAELPSGGTIATADDGCTADARRELYGDLGTWFRVSTVADNLTPLYVPALKRDERFTGALSAWARCMSERGHPYRTPDDVRSELPDLTGDLTTSKAHATEVRLAVAEATCARKSSLARIARNLEREYRDRAVTKGGFHSELGTYRRLRYAALSAA
ncbi:hypothetical protein P8605_40130 [Streptomyces sp. T-3]|nr:hypothetical protein [Streptomyces sp. T-3]